MRNTRRECSRTSSSMSGATADWVTQPGFVCGKSTTIASEMYRRKPPMLRLMNKERGIEGFVRNYFDHLVKRQNWHEEGGPLRTVHSASWVLDAADPEVAFVT